jgi:hypothetical protein
MLALRTLLLRDNSSRHALHHYTLLQEFHFHLLLLILPAEFLLLHNCYFKPLAQSKAPPLSNTHFRPSSLREMMHQDLHLKSASSSSGEFPICSALIIGCHGNSRGSPFIANLIFLKFCSKNT